MKTIKIIDLLNKIANGEEVPKKIKYEGHRCNYDEECFDYFSNDKFIFTDTYYLFKHCFRDGKNHLNDEVEILDEEDEFEDIKELNKSNYQYSQCPSWKEKEEVITIMNNNFKLHQKAIRDIIDNQKKIIERLQHENSKDNV